MRTTIDIPDSLYRQMKATAALRGESVKRFVTAAIEQFLSAPRAAAGRKEVELPLVRTGKPGTLKLTNADIEDLLA